MAKAKTIQNIFISSLLKEITKINLVKNENNKPPSISFCKQRN